MNKQTLAIFALIVSQIFWGASYLMSDYALQVFRPATLVSLRMIIAAIVLGAIGLATGQLQRMHLRDFKFFLFASFCEPFVYFLCEAESLTRVSPTVASVVLSLIPLFTPVFAFIVLREKVTIMNICGIVISLVGVMMIIINRQGRLDADIIGIVLLFVAMVSSITYTLMLRKIPAEYNILSIVFYMFCTSLLFFLPTALVRDYQSIVSIDFSLPDTVNAIWMVVALSLSSSCIAFLFFSFGVRTLGPTRANVFNNIQPGVTAVFAWILALVTHTDPAMTIVKWLGIVVVIVGMFISQVDLKKKVKTFRRKTRIRQIRARRKSASSVNS